MDSLVNARNFAPAVYVTTKIKNCTGETLHRLAKALDVTMEDILADSMEYRQRFDE